MTFQFEINIDHDKHVMSYFLQFFKKKIKNFENFQKFCNFKVRYQVLITDGDEILIYRCDQRVMFCYV